MATVLKFVGAFFVALLVQTTFAISMRVSVELWGVESVITWILSVAAGAKVFHYLID